MKETPAYILRKMQRDREDEFFTTYAKHLRDMLNKWAESERIVTSYTLSQAALALGVSSHILKGYVDSGVVPFGKNKSGYVFSTLEMKLLTLASRYVQGTSIDEKAICESLNAEKRRRNDCNNSNSVQQND